MTLAEMIDWLAVSWHVEIESQPDHSWELRLRGISEVRIFRGRLVVCVQMAANGYDPDEIRPI